MATRPTLSTPQRILSTQNQRARGLPSPSTPHTPLGRSLSGIYGTPQSTFRADDETIVIAIGCRSLRIGYSGESSPRATIHFDASTRRRVGDWSTSAPTRRKKWEGKEEDEWRWWGSEDELWREDCRECDFALMDAKLQRAIRDAVNNNLLAESKSRKVMLGLPSGLPLPVFERLVHSVYGNVPLVVNLTIMPYPILAVVGAGLRAGLVVDIGWNETVVTAVVDFREVLVKRSIRAGKMLSFELGKMLDERLRPARQEAGDRREGGITFEDTEEVLTHVGWCKTRIDEEDDDSTVAIPPLPSTGRTLSVPFSELAQPAETALFFPATDDNDLPLPQLLFNALLVLPIDARRICMSRIIITGGVSKLPGIKTRLIQDVEALIGAWGWDTVKSYGSAEGKVPRVTRLRQRRPLSVIDPNSLGLKVDPEAPPPPSVQSPETDPITRKLEQMNVGNQKETEGGFVRGVETLGPWPAASMLANLRIKGPEIEREKYFHGGISHLGIEYSGWTTRIAKE